MTYCYVCECGKKLVEVLPLTKAGFRPMCSCGAKMERDFTAERPGGHNPACWPMWSDAGGCHPDQIKEYRGALNQAGVDADFRSSDGAIKWESSAHRKRCCEALGLHDRNGGYGDPRGRR